MPSIRNLSRLSVVTLFGIQIFNETIAYPIIEKDQDIKIIEPRFFSKGGKSRPIAGGVVLGGGAILAYNHFKGGSKTANVVIPSEPLSSRNGGPTDSPFLSDTASIDGTDPTSGDPGIDTSAGAGTGALSGTGADSGAVAGVGSGAGAGVGAGAVAGVGSGVGTGVGAGAVAGVGSGVATGVGAGANTLPGTGLGTGTVLVKKEVIRRGEYGALVTRAKSSVTTTPKGSALKSGIGSVGAIVIGSGVLNFFSGLVTGREKKKQEAAEKKKADANGPETKPENNKKTPDKAKNKASKTPNTDSSEPKPEPKSKSSRPVKDDDQTE